MPPATRPAPDLVGSGGHEFGPHPGWMAGLSSTLPDLSGVAQDPVERGNAGQVASFVDQDGPGLGRRLVREAITVQRGQDFGPLRIGQGRRLQAASGWPGWAQDGRGLAPVVRGPRDAQQGARGLGRGVGGDLLDRLADSGLYGLPVSGPLESVSKRPASFPRACVTAWLLASSACRRAFSFFSFRISGDSAATGTGWSRPAGRVPPACVPGWAALRQF